MEAFTFWHSLPQSNNAATALLSTPLSGILHAVLMHYVWRTGLVYSLLFFLWMRPWHTRTLVLFLWGSIFLDPHDRPSVLDHPRALEDSIGVTTGYIGTLLMIRLLVLLGRIGVYIFWKKAIFSIPLILSIGFVPPYIFDEIFIAVEPATDALHYLIGITWKYLPLFPQRIFQFFGYISGSFLSLEHHLARSTWVARMSGRAPYSVLNPFRHKPIDPLEQTRLLRIERRRLFSLPSAELIVYSTKELPPYEAVSHVVTSDGSELHPIVIDGTVAHVSPEVNNIIRRLYSFFSPRLIWIDDLCVDRQQIAEREHHNMSLTCAHLRSFRTLVCLGESSSARMALGFLNTIVLWKWKLGPASAVEKFEMMCENLETGSIVETGMEAFLDMLNHPWFEYAWKCPSVLAGKQRTIVYGHELLMWQFFRHLTGVLDDCDRLRIEESFCRQGKSLRWPSAAIALLRTV